MRVLVCEDDPDTAATLAMLLELEGYETRVCADGLACIAQAADWAPDAATVDIGMPGASGYEVARAIRHMGCGEQILLIAVTGYSGAADIEKARRAGFDVHLRKPPDVPRLVEILRDRRGERRMRQR